MSCKFCQKVDFGVYKAEMNESHIGISTAGGSNRFSTDEQFKYCPECGEKLNLSIKFNFADFYEGKFVVNTKTHEEYNLFMMYLHGKNLKWNSGNTLIQCDHWNIFKKNTCVACDNYLLCVCSPLSFWIDEKRIPIVEFNKNDLD